MFKLQTWGHVGADFKGCRRTNSPNRDKTRMVMVRQMQYLAVRGKHESKLELEGMEMLFQSRDATKSVGWFKEEKD